MTLPQDGQEITQDTVLTPGVYVLPRGLRIRASRVTLDGNGAVLIAGGQTGTGISIENVDQVTVRNLTIIGYYHGIAAHHGRFLTIENCHITKTAELPANTIFLDIFKPVYEACGAGIFLHRVEESTLRGNDLQHQMNGLMAYKCSHLQVENNLANYCSGFGFYLNETNWSICGHNFADFCCRYNPRAESLGHLGADAAGFVIVNHSCHNVFRGNTARMSGDGFFLAGLMPDGRLAGCDHNLFEENDGSYSPNIAFEGTFSSGNIYRRNIASNSNYGFWLGFSNGCTVEHNTIHRNRQAGIATENAYDMTVQHNDFQFNQHGILLWSRYVRSFATAVPQNDTSRDWIISHNQFIYNDTAVRIVANQDHGLRPLPDGTRQTPLPRNHTILHNTIQDSRIGIDLDNVVETTMAYNQQNGNLVANTISRP